MSKYVLFVILLSAGFVTNAFATMNAAIKLSCFDSSIYTDGFSNPLNISIYEENVGSNQYQYILVAGIFDQERQKLKLLTPQRTTQAQILNHQINPHSGVINYSLMRGNRYFSLSIDPSVIPAISSINRKFDPNFYWVGYLKTKGLRQFPKEIELICRHDGIWF